MIRFVFEGEATEKDIPAHGNAIGPAALDVAGVDPGVVFHVRQTSATTWIVTTAGETVTAEGIE